LLRHLCPPNVDATLTVVPYWKERVTYKSILTLLLLLTTAPLPAAEWKLVWSDEFDRPGQPDPTKWGYEEGLVRNNERQYYTRDRRENARVEDGMLIIEARKERFKVPASDSHDKGKRSKDREYAEYTIFPQRMYIDYVRVYQEQNPSPVRSSSK